MFKGLGDMAGLMKQAQEMQSKMADAQERLSDVSVLGEAGAGLVKVSVNAKGTIQGIEVDPTILNPSEKEVIEDLLLAAIRDGQEKAAQAAQEEMAKVTEGLNLPAGMKLPF